MIDLTNAVKISLNLGTIKSGMSYTITHANGSTETKQHTPALQAFLTAQGWIPRKEDVLDFNKNRMERRP